MRFRKRVAIVTGGPHRNQKGKVSMSSSVLVAYATRYGSTKEVAEAVADTLRQSGLAVDCQPAHDIRSLEQYSAVVLGAPLYMGHWHKDAIQFLERYGATLATLPVAIFALGPVHADDKEYQGAREQLDKELAKFPSLTPRTSEIMGGRFDPATLTFPFTLLPGFKKLPASDARDWVAIRAWASDLAAGLQPAAPARV